MNGSFAPTPYTSLALHSPLTSLGVKRGVPLQVELANRSGRTQNLSMASHAIGSADWHRPQKLCRMDGLKRYSIPTESRDERQIAGRP